MTSFANILSAMQFQLIHDSNPINTSGAPRYTITYQFAGNAQPSDTELPFTPGTYSGWTALTAAEKAAVQAAMHHIETFLNVRFVEDPTAADPDLNIGKVTLPGSTTGYGGFALSYTGANPPHTITNYDCYAVYDNTLDISSGQENLILHELGHALGLKHSFSAPALPAAEENNKFTVMSYTANPVNGLYSDHMMLYDIFALQDIWGAAKFHGGRNTYAPTAITTVLPIWDTGGRDKLDASAYAGGVTIDLNPGHFSSLGATDNLVIAYNTWIEDALGGAGNDVITGNKRKNVLAGGAGRDVLKGLGQADTLNGGPGGDKIYGGNGNDTLKGSGGRDRLFGQGGNDTLTGGGNRDKFFITPNPGSDHITDFQDNVDQLVFRHTVFATVADALAAATDTGTGVTFAIGADVLTVDGMSIATIGNDILIA